MDSCLNCGGAIGEPGKAYGWAGKWCQCPVHPSRLYQNPASRPLSPHRVVPMFADPDDLERWLNATRGRDALPRGITCTISLNGGGSSC